MNISKHHIVSETDLQVKNRRIFA